MDVPWARLEEKVDNVVTRLGGVETELKNLDGRVARLADEVHKRGVLLESTDSTIKLVAERTLSLRQAMDREFAELLARLDQRVQPGDAASRYLASKLPAAKRRKKAPRRV